MRAPSPALVLLSALAECGGRQEARDFLAARRHPSAAEALLLLDAHHDGADLALAVLRQISDGEPAVMPSLTPEEWALRFDRAVAISPEASVALHSLADPARLAAATREIVAAMVRFGLLHADAPVLEIGCGIGRFAHALSPLVGRYIGIDVSPRMVAAARLRCADRGNVALRTTGGRDLADIAAASFDLVLAIDVFPYLVASDAALVARHVEEAARVLRPGGTLLIMNFSYRNALARDRIEAAEHATRAGLSLLRNGTLDTEIWDGVTFLMRKG